MNLNVTGVDVRAAIKMDRHAERFKILRGNPKMYVFWSICIRFSKFFFPQKVVDRATY